MKRSSKLLSLLLAGILTASATACSSGQQETESETDTAPAVETETETETLPSRLTEKDDLPEKDFGGEDFNLLGYNFTYAFMYAEELTGAAFNDAVYTRNTDISSRFNVALNVLGQDNDYKGVSTNIRNSVAAGEDTYDLVSYHFVKMGSDLLADLYMNFQDVPYVNFDRPWWNSSTKELLTVDDKTFLAFGSLNLTTIAKASCILYNLGMAEEYSLEDVFPIVTEGSWTLEKMCELAEVVCKDTDGNGVKDETDQYGYAYNIANMSDLQLAFGKLIVEKDENGRLTTEKYYDEKLVDIYSKLLQLHNETPYVWNATSGNVGIDRFIENTVLCGHGRIEMTQWGLRDTEIDYAILPLPKWNEEQDSYYTVIEGSGDSQAVLKTAQNLEKVGVITEALNAESWKTCEEAYYEITIKHQTARAEENLEILDMIMETRRFDFGYVYGGWESNNGGAMFWLYKALGSSDEITSYYQARKAKWEGYMDSVIAAFENYES